MDFRQAGARFFFFLSVFNLFYDYRRMQRFFFSLLPVIKNRKIIIRKRKIAFRSFEMGLYLRTFVQTI